MTPSDSPSSKNPGKSGPLLSEFADDPDMLELVEMFVAELPDRVSAIQSALDQQDHATLTTLSHQLKGAAGGYGFSPITNAALEVEQAAKARRTTSELQSTVNELIDLCNRASALDR